MNSTVQALRAIPELQTALEPSVAFNYQYSFKQ